MKRQRSHFCSDQEGNRIISFAQVSHHSLNYSPLIFLFFKSFLHFIFDLMNFFKDFLSDSYIYFWLCVHSCSYSSTSIFWPTSSHSLWSVPSGCCLLLPSTPTFLFSETGGYSISLGISKGEWTETRYWRSTCACWCSSNLPLPSLQPVSTTVRHLLSPNSSFPRFWWYTDFDVSERADPYRRSTRR